MTRSIEIVPALRCISLVHVGCWEELNLEFIPGLNILTEESSAWGKTTIFRAICQALLPSTQLEYPLSATLGFSGGSISVELMSPTISVRLAALDGVQPKREGHLSTGQTMLTLLQSHLEAASPGNALLVEDEVMSSLDLSLFHIAAKLLNGSGCQVICQISHRLNLADFPKARVYGCSLDSAGKARMRLLTTG